MMISTMRARILTITTCAVVGSLAVTAGATYALVRANTTRSIEENMQAVLSGNALAVERWVDAKAQAVAAAGQDITPGDPHEIVKYMKSAAGFQITQAGWPDKAFVSTITNLPANYDPTSRPWYKAGISAGHPTLTQPYGDVVTGIPYVSFVAPIMRDGTPAGVVAGAVILDGIRDIVRAVHPTPSSLGFVVNAQGKVIAHPDPKLTLKAAAEISPALTADALGALSKNTALIEIDVGGATKLMRALPVKGTDWMLVVALDKSEATAGLTDMLKISAVAIVVLAVVTTSIAAALTSRSFRRLSGVRDAMARIGAGGGDLTHRLQEAGTDEVAQISRSFNTFVDKINSVLHEIRASAESMRTATQEIQIGNRDMSYRTEASAANLQQTSASLSTLTGSIKQSADSLAVATSAANSSRDAAALGVQVVSSAIGTMEEISRSSARITEIIGVIDGIAFQTNILALNAAVEAARAGEGGRGFAVVAGEVRTLAQRSAVAAREIKELIEASEQSVKAGSTSVQAAGQNMSQVMSRIEQVSFVIGEINQSLAVQSAGIDAIDRSIAELDNATQQNSALVEQTSAASASLAEQAVTLSRTVAAFRLADRVAA